MFVLRKHSIKKMRTGFVRKQYFLDLTYVRIFVKIYITYNEMKRALIRGKLTNKIVQSLGKIDDVSNW